MAKSHICCLLFLVGALYLMSTFSAAQEYAQGPKANSEAGGGSLSPEECPGRCDYRCSATKHRKDFCVQTCMSCCTRCLCVPSGTYGHKEECPCYNDLKTKEGEPKCP